MLGQHEQVLTDLPALRARIVELSDEPADNDIMEPWNVQEVILDTGCRSAEALGRYEQALDLANEIITMKRRRGASPHEMACTRFNNYGPLLRLSRLTEADQLLSECQDVFDTAGDITMLGLVYSARADLEDKRSHRQDAVNLERIALRLKYTRSVPRDISISHHNLADYLSRARVDLGEQRAHRLATALLDYLIGDTHALTQILHKLAGELRDDVNRPDALVLP